MEGREGGERRQGEETKSGEDKEKQTTEDETTGSLTSLRGRHAACWERAHTRSDTRFFERNKMTSVRSENVILSPVGSRRFPWENPVGKQGDKHSITSES